MKLQKRRIVFILILLIIAAGIAYVLPVHAEIIYLKDGQVLKGSIVFENKKIVKVKTKYMTRILKRAHIKRVLYGERDMEQIYILLTDDTVIQGFLVDQDATKVVYRIKKNSPKDITISKTKVVQLSREEIKLLNPDVYVKPGLFIPLNIKGAKIQPAFGLLAGSSLTFSYIKGMRAFFEAGYSKCIDSEDSSRYVQFIPILVGFNYTIPILNRLSVVPKLGVGLTIVDFIDNEGDEARGFDFTATAGVGTVFRLIPKLVDVGVYADYFMIIEKDSQFHNIMVSGMVSVKF